jgi:hypothetical protein
LPYNYYGCNLRDIFNKLQRREKYAASKGEFETTVEFEKRVSKEKNKPIVGSIQLTSVVSFRMKIDEKIYDADDETLQIKVGINKPTSSKFKFNKFAQWDYTSNNGSFNGTNAYGAKIQVDTYETFSYNLLIDNNLEWERSKYYKDDNSEWGKIIINLHASPHEAKQIVPRINVVFICTLTPPYNSLDEDYIKATFNSPTEVTSHDYYVHANVSQIWVFNEKTGEVISKISPGKD